MLNCYEFVIPVQKSQLWLISNDASTTWKIIETPAGNAGLVAQMGGLFNWNALHIGLVLSLILEDG